MILGPDGVTTGASNDIERATHLARSMVAKWGLSERLGPLKYDEDDGEVFLGMSAGSRPKSMSPQTARLIDEEVRRIIDESYQQAKDLLTQNQDKLAALADALIEYETLNNDQIGDIMAGRKARPPSDSNETPARNTDTRPTSGRTPRAPNIGGPAEEH
jgi:cell division protease FtsH